jgi:hypothetical protein
LAATVLGIPAGLYINRLAAEQSAAELKRQEQKQLAEAQAVIAENLRDEKPNLINISQMSDAAHYYIAPISPARWEAVKDTFLRLSTDSLLKAELAEFFWAVDTLTRLIDLHRDFSVGVQASMSGSGKVRQRLGNAIKGLAEGLAGQIDILLTGLGATTQPPDAGR